MTHVTQQGRTTGYSTCFPATGKVLKLKVDASVWKDSTKTTSQWSGSSTCGDTHANRDLVTGTAVQGFSLPWEMGMAS